VADNAGDAPSIWLISDGNPGHYNQSLAVAEALQRAGYGRIVWVQARQHIRGFARPLVARLIQATRSELPVWLENMVYDFPEGRPTGRPDLIISSGGKTAFLNVLLARRLGCANVFIGPPPDISTRQFKVVLHAEEDVQGDNRITMDYLPTRLDPVKAARAGTDFIAAQGLAGRRLACMLLGGNSRSHHYLAEDWQALAQGMNYLAQKYDLAWLLTTSRRTGREAEAILRAELEPARVADATWWGGDPRPVVIPYLGAADVAFCTQDSLTMLSEAISSGRPVFALFPETLRHDALESSFNKRFLAANVAASRLIQVPVKAMDTCNLAPGSLADTFQPVSTDIMQDTITALLDWLGQPGSPVQGRHTTSRQECQVG
jgi:mitochondrial fission protein ELM1